MEIEIIEQSKGELEVKVDNITVAEVLRVYLNEQGVEFAAWRREHPTKPIIFRIHDANAKKAVSDAVNGIKEDLNKINSLKSK